MTFAGVRLRWPAMMRLTCIGILAQFALLLLAFGVLTYCFLISDFSVIYVAQHSYSLLSWELKLAAVWGGHEGSLLLWGCCFPPGARCLPGIIGSKPIRYFR